jgi:hypothetical protein
MKKKIKKVIATVTKKVKELIATVTKKVRELIATARERLSHASQALREFFRAHGDQIAQDPGYAAAFIAVVAALVEVITNSEQVRYMAHKLADAYIALHRLLRPRWRGGYDDTGDDWA